MTNFDTPTHLTVSIEFKETKLGNACGNVYLRNLANATCNTFFLDMNLRPGWGFIGETVGGKVSLVARSKADVEVGAFCFSFLLLCIGSYACF